MADEKNIIVAGKYAGEKVVLSVDTSAYLAGSRVSIFKETVESVRIVNTRDGDALTGYFVAGIGTIVGQDFGGFSMVKIVWKDGSKSLAKMTKGGADILVAAAFSNIGYRSTQDTQAEKKNREVKNRVAWASLTKGQRGKVYLLKILAIIAILAAIVGGVILGLAEIIWAAALCVIIFGVTGCLLYLKYYRKRNATDAAAMMVTFPFVRLSKGPKLQPDGELVFPEGCKEIKSVNKKFAEKATAIVLPRSLEYVEQNAFRAFSRKLVPIYYSGDFNSWCKIKGLGTLQKTNLHIQGIELSDDLVIPAGVQSIGEFAFCQNKALTSVVIPDGVTGIGDYAIAFCDNLNSVTIPASVTDIGSCVFGYSKMTSILYQGTVAQWQSIRKHPRWDDSIPKDYIVHCTDGTVTKQ